MEDHDCDIQITANGYLRVKRGDQLKPQCCPFAPSGVYDTKPACGDWCPLFGEPHAFDYNTIRINLCYDKMLSCKIKKFQDLRVIRKGD